MKYKGFVLILSISAVLFASSSWAGPAAPIIYTLEQPDGTKFKAKTEGDEWNNWTVTEDGYTILKDEDTGYWVYAKLDTEGKLEKTHLRVGIDEPIGIEKGLRPKIKNDMENKIQADE